MKDVFFIFGLGLLGAGCWWVYPPASLIVVGLVLLASGLYAATRRQGKR